MQSITDCLSQRFFFNLFLPLQSIPLSCYVSWDMVTYLQHQFHLYVWFDSNKSSDQSQKNDNSRSKISIDGLKYNLCLQAKLAQV